jgi:riboflavin biosynthesis pyrimidine reductase
MDLTRLADLDDDALRAHYAPVRTPWLRLNFVATLDGAAQGADGLSGSINNAADGRVFAALRAIADVIVVGAGTARTEDYQVNDKTVVVVSRRADVPETLGTSPRGGVLLATVDDAPGLAAARETLGAENVLTFGSGEPDLAGLRRELEGRGYRDLLCEGGPHLAADLLAAGLVDELCLTVVPRLVAGAHLRIAAGRELDVPLELHGLLEADGTLLGRWLVSP